MREVRESRQRSNDKRWKKYSDSKGNTKSKRKDKNSQRKRKWREKIKRSSKKKRSFCKCSDSIKMLNQKEISQKINYQEIKKSLSESRILSRINLSSLILSSLRNQVMNQRYQITWTNLRRQKSLRVISPLITFHRFRDLMDSRLTQIKDRPLEMIPQESLFLMMREESKTFWRTPFSEIP